MKTKYITLYLFMFVCVAVGVYDHIFCEMVESFMVFSFLPNWVLVISIIISFILGLYYSLSLLSHKSVVYLSSGAKLIRMFLWTPMISVGIMAMMYGLFSGGTLFINRLAGEQHEIYVSGKVLESKAKRTRLGKRYYYVTIMTKNLDVNREIDLKVYNKWLKGQRFHDKMIMGSLGIFYKK